MLVANLNDTNEYATHVRIFKIYISNHRLVLKKVHRVIKFEIALRQNERAWLKPYLGMNTDLRKKAKNVFEK